MRNFKLRHSSSISVLRLLIVPALSMSGTVFESKNSKGTCLSRRPHYLIRIHALLPAIWVYESLRSTSTLLSSNNELDVLAVLSNVRGTRPHLSLYHTENRHPGPNSTITPSYSLWLSVNMQLPPHFSRPTPSGQVKSRASKQSTSRTWLKANLPRFDPTRLMVSTIF
jgi:hypothetical protein